MCTRIEVEHIVEKSTTELKEAVKELRREHSGWQAQLQTYLQSEEKRVQENERRMQEVATAAVSTAKDNFVKYVGWGGIIGIGMVVYFFGGLNSRVETLQVQLSEVQDSQKEVSEFMTNTSGNRFTLDDGNKLKTYVDQSDQLLQRQLDNVQQTMKDGFAETKDLIRNLHSNNT
jgi:ElaB/YqjD/DUF883 family membrane-anchored ribosome-binding protein